MMDKAEGAFLTIGELAQQLGVAQHILRYWESRFPQLRPLQRAGNRRYYRPQDVEVARRIHRLLNHEGYTVRGVQKVLRDRTSVEPQASPVAAMPVSSVPAGPEPDDAAAAGGVDVFRLIALRNRLQAALEG